METIITKTVKGATMEAIFDNCQTFSVRNYDAENITEDNYNPESKYKYEIRIRHAENTDANVLFEEARFKEENMKPVNAELTALQNGVNSTKVENLTIHEKYSDDKRKKVKKYFLQYGKATISPTLDYDNMNHFILGFNRAKEVLITFKNNYQ